jgi:hypothetical protein
MNRGLEGRAFLIGRILAGQDPWVDQKEPGPAAGRIASRAGRDDIDLEIEPFHDLPGIFGESQLLPGKGPPAGLAVGVGAWLVDRGR